MKRTKYNLSHYKDFTGDIGELIPLTWLDVLPGDSIQHKTNLLLRTTPLLAPVMHPCQIRIHHWFVPTRIIWDDFPTFITGGDDGNDSTTPPYIDLNGVTVSSGDLLDYLGVPPAVYPATTFKVSAGPARAYSKIYNEFYRDKDLVTELTINTGNGADATTNTTMQNVSYEKDIFTTSRPWEQKGTAINIPIGTSAPVVAEGTGLPTFYHNGAGSYNLRNSGTTPTQWNASGAAGSATWNDPALEADLSAATGINVNELKEYFAFQKFMENSGHYGSDYSELLKRWGVNPQDSRLQRPEYLGGGRKVIQFSEVLSTDGANTADMKGHGLSALQSNRYRKFFPEHGILMTVMSVVPKSIYATGLHKSFSREDKFDYYQPELSALGDQEILNKEVYSEHTTPDGVFGYNRRYDEYRTHPSSIAGEFRDSSLNHWHMARIFGSDPSLNQTFIEVDNPDRVFASTSTDSLLCMAYHSIQARRPVTMRR